MILDWLKKKINGSEIRELRKEILYLRANSICGSKNDVRNISKKECMETINYYRRLLNRINRGDK